MHRRTFVGATAGVVALHQLLLPSITQASAAPRTVRAEHPRLLVTNFDQPRAAVAHNPDAQAWYEQVRATAERILTLPAAQYQLTGIRLLPVCREVNVRVYALSLAYAIEGDQRYRDRLWREVEAVCGFKDWNHQQHFLDVGEMCHAVAIAYDWWHAEWSPEQRGIMQTAIVENALKPGLEVYPQSAELGLFHTVTNNWNIVCNGGLILGALAIYETHSEIADRVLDQALESIKLGINEYRPDGGYPEGSYWEYATKYLVVTLAGMQTAMNHTALKQLPGISTTVDFRVHLIGPTQLPFNYYDAEPNAVRIPEILWLADQFDRPDYAWAAIDAMKATSPSWAMLPIGLLWWPTVPPIGPVANRTALDAMFSRCAVATSRSGWERTDAVYVGGKGGDNSTNHSDLDLGAFVLDALGQRWFTELGIDNYDLPGYYDKKFGQRWTYYRKRPEGQNTLVVNPGANPGQRGDSTGAIVAHEVGPGEAWFVVDASDADEQISTWRRGWRLFDGRTRVVVQDEISLKQAGELWWFAHTEADITISDDGRTATLERMGERLVARLVTPDLRFVQMEARPLWTSPDPAGQNPNLGIRKLAIRLPATDQATITFWRWRTGLNPQVRWPSWLIWRSMARPSKASQPTTFVTGLRFWPMLGSRPRQHQGVKPPLCRPCGADSPK